MESSSLLRMKSASHDYQFEVNYTKSKDLPIGEYIASSTFNFEGYEWAIHYYPRYKGKYNQFLSLKLLSKAINVCAEFSFNLLDENETSIMSSPLPTLSCTFIGDGKGYGSIFHVNEFMDMYSIFIISCKIRVLSGPRNVVNMISGGLHEHMEKLLNMSDKFDVTFEVEGKKISAHRLIVAARSPVFEAELFGSMAEVNMKCIRIEDMKADVFMAMLRFMYTDQISSGKTLSIELVQDLFVAADRYAVEKLKEMCKQILCNNLSVGTVSTTLLLADQHSCIWLKEMCLRFASKPENFMQLALTDEYHHMIQACPSLLVELREKFNDLSGVGNKKQRIV
ncbi:speckle-type POZ family protein [Carex littledalei]|uniref:Speckle-type POZ family protein n=1 Tax=Carex littledalei TaxID=544730 RepID=A0A833VHG0_9POAL|nr:speckle-type POZ family protein [Carex littledalei]